MARKRSVDVTEDQVFRRNFGVKMVTMVTTPIKIELYELQGNKAA